MPGILAMDWDGGPLNIQTPKPKGDIRSPRGYLGGDLSDAPLIWPAVLDIKNTSGWIPILQVGLNSVCGLQHQLLSARESLRLGMEGNGLTPKALDSLMKKLCVGPTSEDILLRSGFGPGCIAIGPFIGSAGKVPFTEFLGVVILLSKLLKIKQITK